MTSDGIAARRFWTIAAWTMLPLFLALPGCQANHAGGKTNDAVSRKPGALVDALSELSLWQLTGDWPATEEPPALDIESNAADSFIGRPIPQQTDLAYDMPRFFLWKAPDDPRFWIQVTGPSGTEWRGPARLDPGGRLKLAPESG